MQRTSFAPTTGVRRVDRSGIADAQRLATEYPELSAPTGRGVPVSLGTFAGRPLMSFLLCHWFSLAGACATPA